MASAKHTGFYSGSFDPITKGHMDVIRRSLHLVDWLVIGVGINAGKSPVFSAEERVELIEAEVKPLAREAGAKIEVSTFSGLAVDAAKACGATVIIRGVRDATDLAYEMQMAGMNGAMAPGIATIFLPASPEVSHIAASLVRQIAQMGGDVGPFVTPSVARKLKSKLARRR